MRYNKFLVYLICLLIFPINALAYSNKIVLGGDNVGIVIKSDGILVAGFYKINNKMNNSKLSVGDYILKVNNEDVFSIDDLISKIETNVSDNRVNITYRHINQIKETTLNLEYVNGTYRTGLYVKDGLKGLGTLTYIDPESKIFGCLGHEIIESNTNSKVDVRDGNIYKADVSSITKSRDGNVGTKNSSYFSQKAYGNINKNEIEGVYGKYTGEIDNDNLIDVGDIKDVEIGSAYIYTSLDDNIVKPYKINIIKKDEKNKVKNYLFEIVDDELLKRTGGVIQGMSGSPIVQNNKIIGAVTHVMLDSVTSGYGISIKNMLIQGES